MRAPWLLSKGCLKKVRTGTRALALAVNGNLDQDNMFPTRLRGFCLLLLAALVAPSTSIKPRDGAPPGDYDSYVIALEFQPVWSQNHCTEGEIVPHLEGGAYASEYMSIHGLWPNYDPATRGGYTWPQFCDRSGVVAGEGDYVNCKNSGSPAYNASFCDIDPATLAAFNVSNRWQRYGPMYAWDDLRSPLVEHEWAKHGSCTSWNQSTYFTLIEAVYAEVSEGQGPQLVHASVGKALPFETLEAAFKAQTGGKTVTLQCNHCYLSEVWFAAEAVNGTLEPDLSAFIDNADGGGSCQACDNVTILNFTQVGCSSNWPPSGPPTPAGATCQGKSRREAKHRPRRK